MDTLTGSEPAPSQCRVPLAVPVPVPALAQAPAPVPGRLQARTCQALPGAASPHLSDTKMLNFTIAQCAAAVCSSGRNLQRLSSAVHSGSIGEKASDESLCRPFFLLPC